jgi:hypothetical protein
LALRFLRVLSCRSLKSHALRDCKANAVLKGSRGLKALPEKLVRQVPRLISPDHKVLRGRWAQQDHKVLRVQSVKQEMLGHRVPQVLKD